MPRNRWADGRRYCRCGASLWVRSDAQTVADVTVIWLGVHTGRGHGPTDALHAAQARYQQQRQLLGEEVHADEP